MAQNVALVLVDKNYENVENQALFALSSIMKDYLLEFGKEMKTTCEMQGRTEVTMIDSLNAAYEYGVGQQEMVDHLAAKELTMLPTQNHLKV